MSVIYQNGNCTYISHNKYIETVYNGDYKLKDDLFEINVPFKKRSIKRKLQQSAIETAFQEIKSDSAYVSREYSEFYKILKREEHLIPKQLNNIDNLRALKISGELYEESGLDLPVNTKGKNLLKVELVGVGKKKYLFPVGCEFFCEDVKDMKSNLCGSKFDFILMDPPWWNKAVRRKNLQTHHGYKMMTNEELKEIPIDDLLSDNGIVVLWCTNSPQHIQACEQFFEKWGVKLIAKWFWLKICKNGETVINFADPPNKLPFERILIARKIRANNKELTNSIEECGRQTSLEETVSTGEYGRQTSLNETDSTGECRSPKSLEETDRKILISVPSALHSHKPPISEILKPYLKSNAKCLEVFARYLLPQCTSYGLEVLRFQNECLYESITPFKL